MGRRSRLRSALALASAIGIAVAVACGLGLLAAPLQAQQIGPELAGRLSEPQQRVYVLYLRARKSFDVELQAYWIAADEKRETRRRKRAAAQAITADDYIVEQPPKYGGPQLAPEIGKIIAAIQPPAEPDAPKPGVAEFLASARAEFGFVPTPSTEREFKLRYAEEALRLGLTKAQVVRVYALETGGRGTYDMQAGIDPDTRQGRPISSALGYAQLLNANSVNELVKHGDAFIARLNAIIAAPDTPARRATLLRSKVIAVRRMVLAARAVPNVWKEQVRLGNTPKGLGIHALNLDADIGPWLQAIKLKGLKDDAERAGRTALSGAEIELMNLSGPRTGLEMMEAVGRAMPTSNFFSQAGYYRNTIVRDKTAAQLLAAIEEKMDVTVKKPGSVEFATAFDEVIRRRSGPALR